MDEKKIRKGIPRSSILTILHELGNAVNDISCTVQVLERELKQTTDSHELINILKDACTRMENSLQKLRQLASSHSQ